MDVGDLLSLTDRLGARKGLRRGTSAAVWYERGCALEASDPAAAIVAYRRALAGQTGFADAHNNLGRLCHDQGDLAAAEACYRLALCAARGVALYWFNLGVAIEDQGRTAEAIAAYQAALAIDVALADAHYNLARLLERIGRAGNDLALRRALHHLASYRRLTAQSARG
jgi:tetratricopeptide (TPR) repeat protein